MVAPFSPMLEVKQPLTSTKAALYWMALHTMYVQCSLYGDITLTTLFSDSSPVGFMH